MLLHSECDDVICVEDTVHNSGPPANCDERTITAVKSHKHKKKRKHHQIEDNQQPSHDHHIHKKHASRPTAAVVSWLAPNLRVRIISKDYCKGLYYNQKVSFLHTVDVGLCRVQHLE